MARDGRNSEARRLAAAGGALAYVERSVGITPSGLVLLVLAVAGWVLARVIGSKAMFLLVYGLVVVIGISWLLGRRGISVAARRSDLPTRVRQGQRVDVELAVKARRRISTVVLHETLHTHLGRTVRIPVPLLPANEEMTHVYSFVPNLRGVYEVGPLTASWSDPFGLTRRTMTLTEPTKIIVHPRTEMVHDRVQSREWEDPPVRPPYSKPWPTGFEFYGMRDYVPGDDPRRIVWRATARMLDPDNPMNDRYLLRESEQGITDRVAILLDTDARSHSPGDPSETFEAAVRTVASLGVRHLTDGFAVTVDTNGARIAQQLRGQRNRIRLLDELAKTKPERAPLQAAIDRLLVDRRTDTHLVIVTPNLEQNVVARIRLLMDRGISVMLVMVLCDESDPASLHRAGSLGTNVVEVYADSPLEGVFRKVFAGGARRI